MIPETGRGFQTTNTVEINEESYEELSPRAAGIPCGERMEERE